MKCKICGSEEIKGDCQYINGNYYHNSCIENLQQENKELHNKIDKVIEILKLCNSQCAKETIKILKDSDVDEK